MGTGSDDRLMAIGAPVLLKPPSDNGCGILLSFSPLARLFEGPEVLLGYTRATLRLRHILSCFPHDSRHILSRIIMCSTHT